ncbi:MAG: hypothetical protein HY929_01110 [Euryarchaeota archaeon]|nr:hypothetical protein [Euryarchaeota archaeon]
MNKAIAILIVAIAMVGSISITALSSPTATLARIYPAKHHWVLAEVDNTLYAKISVVDANAFCQVHYVVIRIATNETVQEFNSTIQWLTPGIWKIATNWSKTNLTAGYRYKVYGTLYYGDVSPPGIVDGTKRTGVGIV